MYHVHVGAHRPEEGANSLELVLAGSCKLSDAVLGTKLQSSTRAVSALNY